MTTNRAAFVVRLLSFNRLGATSEWPERNDVSAAFPLQISEGNKVINVAPIDSLIFTAARVTL